MDQNEIGETNDQQQQPLPDSGYFSPDQRFISEEPSTESVFNFDDTAPIVIHSSFSNPPSPTAIVDLDHTRGSVYARRVMRKQRHNSYPFSTPKNEFMHRSRSLQEDNRFSTTPCLEGANESPSTSANASGQKQIAIVRPMALQVMPVMVPQPALELADANLDDDHHAMIALIGNRLRFLADEFDREMEQRGQFIVNIGRHQNGIREEILEELMQGFMRAVIFLFLL